MRPASRGKELSGLRDKLYWRLCADGDWHCFSKRPPGAPGERFRSLCERFSRPNSGGQASRRPEPLFRCARCDVAEMKRRGWDESGPTLVPRIPPRRPPSDPGEEEP